MASRRALLTLLGIGGAYVGFRAVGPVVLDFISGDPKFRALEQPAGFRTTESGALSSTLVDPFFGLETADAITPAPFDIQSGTLCNILFGPETTQDSVPLAYFSDYNCPYCRVLSKRLVKMAERADKPIKLVWHELPLLGPSSVLGAFAALAAAEQDAYVAFHESLNSGAAVINEAFIGAVAQELGLDVHRLFEDMENPKIVETLRRSKAVADLFGAIGTPFMVVGRTAILGEIGAKRLERLVEIERDAGPLPGCD